VIRQLVIIGRRNFSNKHKRILIVSNSASIAYQEQSLTYILGHLMMIKKRNRKINKTLTKEYLQQTIVTTNNYYSSASGRCCSGNPSARCRMR